MQGQPKKDLRQIAQIVSKGYERNVEIPRSIRC